MTACGAYWQTLGHGFVWDDHIVVEGNPFVLETANARKLVSLDFYRTVTPVEGAARPVMLASLLVDRALSPADPRGYHRTNVLLHGAAAGAFYLFTAASGAAPALAAGLVFAVHPVNTEAVDVVSFRADLLAAFFGFLALLLYLRARRAQGAARWAWLPAAGACYALALLSKEMAITVPPLAALWELTRGRRVRPAAAVRAAACALAVAVTALYLAFRAPRSEYRGVGGSKVLAAFKGVAPTAPAPAPPRSELFDPAADPSPPSWRPLYADPSANARAMTVVGARYLGLLVWPRVLRADRAPELFDRWLDAKVLRACALLLALLAGLLWSARAASAWAWVVGWWFLALVPVSNLVPLYNPVAERYLYFVCPGAAWAAALLVARLPRRARAAALGGLVLMLGARTRARNADWASDEAFLQAELRRGDPSARVLYNAGLLRQREGKLEEARVLYERSRALHPGSVETTVNLASVLLALGRNAESRALFGEAERLGWKPTPEQLARRASDLVNRGVDAHRAGRLADAAALLDQALRLDGADATARHDLAKVRVDQGRLREARRLLEDVAAADPARTDARYDLAVVCQRLGDPRAAEAAYRGVVEREERLEALHNLSGLLEASGRLEEAESFALRAAALAPSHPGPQTVLGNVYLKRGRPDLALPHYRLALEASSGPEEPAETAALARANVAACLRMLGRSD